MRELKYKVGDKVLIKSYDWYEKTCIVNGDDILENIGIFPFFPHMAKFCGQVLTIKDIHITYYTMEETDYHTCWTDEMIECKVHAIENGEIIPEPLFSIGDSVFIRTHNKPHKVLRRCYDEYWRYELDGLEDSDYWFYEKELYVLEKINAVVPDVRLEKVDFTEMGYVHIETVKDWLYNSFFEYEDNSYFGGGYVKLESVFDTFEEMMENFNKTMEE